MPRLILYEIGPHAIDLARLLFGEPYHMFATIQRIGWTLDRLARDQANLSGAEVSWQSHYMIAEILFRAAGDAREKRKIAGLVKVNLDCVGAES